ncbi:MAG: lipoprotein signal peptidase [Eikenella sp.]|nr:lipoprotein signal peptidase [Eikenella sp.]
MHFCVVRLCPMGTARSLACLYDMSVPPGFPAFTLAALLRLELHPHLRVLQRSRAT